MMTSKDFTDAEVVDARSAVAIIEGWFDGDGFPPDASGAMLVHVSNGRMIGITIEDVTG